MEIQFANIGAITLGYIFHLIIDVIYGVKKSKGSPDRFSWTYLWKDNYKILPLLLLYIYIFGQYTGDIQLLAQKLLPALADLSTEFICILLGFFFQVVIGYVRKKKEIGKLLKGKINELQEVDNQNSTS